jgi:hypothetical protein
MPGAVYFYTHLLIAQQTCVPFSYTAGHTTEIVCIPLCFSSYGYSTWWLGHATCVSWICFCSGSVFVPAGQPGENVRLLVGFGAWLSAVQYGAAGNVDITWVAVTTVVLWWLVQDWRPAGLGTVCQVMVYIEPAQHAKQVMVYRARLWGVCSQVVQAVLHNSIWR